ncbi:MAG: YkgJ family cysteine cluster protein [Deltaproteobacteria bacterium]|nr:YkgJ family cysteine cluster protein [Deltaproteobacteria bacterium]
MSLPLPPRPPAAAPGPGSRPAVNQAAWQEAHARLQDLRARADAAFAEVAGQFPREVACRPGCDDCCHALFDLTPVEALDLARAYARLPREERRAAARRGSKASRAYDRVVAEALAAPPAERLTVFSRARVTCPLLTAGRCLLYASRPLTCRLYGIPVAVEGHSRTCGRAGFAQGQVYPSVDFGRINALLEEASRLALEAVPELPRSRLDLGRVLAWADNHTLTLKGDLP